MDQFLKLLFILNDFANKYNLRKYKYTGVNQKYENYFY